VMLEGRMCLGLATPRANAPDEKEFRRKWVVA
jgi:hypothetical protein